MINLRKRMAGYEDMDTVEDVCDDFNEGKYPGSSEQYEYDLMVQIQYIISLINRKGGNLLQVDVLDVIVKAKTLRDLRNDLCSFTAKHKLVQKPPQSKRGSSMSKMSTGKGKPTNPENAARMKQSNIDFFSPPMNPKPCIGPQGKVSKKNHECVYISWNDFCHLYTAKRSGNNQEVHISSLAEDFIHMITIGKINLKKFEAEMMNYREYDERVQKYQNTSRL